MHSSLRPETQSSLELMWLPTTWAFLASLLLGIHIGSPGPLALHSPGHLLSPQTSSSLRNERQQTEILRPLPACPVPRAFFPVPRVGGASSGMTHIPLGHAFPPVSTQGHCSLVFAPLHHQFFIPTRALLSADHVVIISTSKAMLSVFPSHPGWRSKGQIYPPS